LEAKTVVEMIKGKIDKKFKSHIWKLKQKNKPKIKAKQNNLNPIFGS